MLNIKIIVGIISGSLLLLTLELIRRTKLKEKYALLWIFTSIGIFIFSFSPKIIQFLSKITGMYYLSLISMAAYLFLLMLVLHFSVVISGLHEKNKVLTQVVAILQQKVKGLEERKQQEE